MKRKGFVLIDRDGTIIREKCYLHRPEEVEFIPGAVAGMRALREHGYGLVLVTNQSGVGRGYFGEEDVWRVHARLREMLHAEGVYLDGIYYCPHHPDEGCRCRKPGTALVEDARRDLGLDPSRCCLVGDNRCDLELGRRIGARTVLVRTGYGTLVADDPGVAPDRVAADFAAAAAWICGRSPYTLPAASRPAAALPEPVA